MEPQIRHLLEQMAEDLSTAAGALNESRRAIERLLAEGDQPTAQPTGQRRSCTDSRCKNGWIEDARPCLVCKPHLKQSATVNDFGAQ